MKKFLIAGAAMAALVAGPASADEVFQGSASSAISQMVAGGTANAVSMNGLQNIQNIGQITRLRNLRTLGQLPDNVSLITLNGSSAADNGTAQTSTSNTFTLTGDVNPDCSFFVGNVNTTIDFGTIGIEARDNVGPAAAFDMTAPATAQIQTNVAGCNTRNLVRVTKGNPDGMRNASTSGYDPAQFTNKLPYSVDVSFNGSAPNSAAAQAGAFTVDTAEQTDSQLHGAWKSVFTMNINVPTPAESLLAGAYTDTVNVSLTVQP